MARSPAIPLASLDAMTQTRDRLNNAGVGQWETAEEAAARMAALARLRSEPPTEPQRRAG